MEARSSWLVLARDLQGTPRPREFLASAGQGPPIAVDVALAVAVAVAVAVVLAVAAAVL